MSLGTFTRNFVLFLFLFLLPNQVGLHIWPPWSVVQGLHIDYLSLTIYLSYFFIFALIVAFLWTKKTTSMKSAKQSFIPLSLLLLIPLIYLTSQNPILSLSKFCLLLILTILFLAIVKFTKGLSWGWSGLALTSTWASLLAVVQFLSQRSQGLWLLGEREISAVTPGAAKEFLNLPLPGLGHFQGEFLRPYSTFSHPNSLAGFLLVSLFLIIFLQRFIPHALLFLSCSLSVIVIVLSGSRSVTMTFVILGLFYLLYPIFKFKNVFFPLLLVVLTLFIVPNLFISDKSIPSQFLHQQSIMRRVEENKVALSLFISQPIFGIGLGNFIPALGETIPSSKYPNLSTPTLWLQPVHNIFLLIASETGLVGLGLTLLTLCLSFRKLYHSENLPLMFALFAILLTGLFDHYWLTLIQNQLLFSITLGLIWRREASRLIK